MYVFYICVCTVADPGGGGEGVGRERASGNPTPSKIGHVDKIWNRGNPFSVLETPPPHVILDPSPHLQCPGSASIQHILIIPIFKCSKQAISIILDLLGNPCPGKAYMYRESGYKT